MESISHLYPMHYLALDTCWDTQSLQKLFHNYLLSRDSQAPLLVAVYELIQASMGYRQSRVVGAKVVGERVAQARGIRAVMGEAWSEW